MAQIGRYNVERLLARGGMAEVYLGKAEGPGGFSKVVVIKRILPELAEDPQFIEMFLSEARLAAQLSHPNVVQVFDFGEHEGQYYLAMEYVRGETLRTLVRAHQKLGKSIPSEVAARAVIGVCEGLHYAHELVDEKGVSHNIVHRDVTPDNIIVSTAGVPKLLDFGIAKAATNVHSTAAGTVKGKYAYMAPELIRGEPAGRQLDVYALGVTLYELLSLKRPFESATELGLMKTILDGSAKPLTVADGVDPQLAEIVALAMNPNPAGRYADAHEFQLALEDWLATSGKRAGATELAAVVAEVTQLRGGQPSLGRLDAVKGTPVSGVRHNSGLKAAIDSSPDPRTVVGEPLEVRQKSRRKVVLGVGLGVAAFAIVCAVVFFATRPPAVVEVDQRRPVGFAEEPPEVPVPQPVGAPVPTPVPDPEPVAVPVVKVQPLPPAAPKPVAKVVKGEDGYLTLRTDPWCDVYLGGDKLGTTPLVRTPIPSGKLTLVLRNPRAGANRRLVVVVEPGVELKQALVMPQGTLELSLPAGTEVTLDGQPLGKTPMEPLDVVEGKHELKFNGSTRAVKVKAGQREVIQ